MKKKLLSVILAAGLCISLMPYSSYPEEIVPEEIVPDESEETSARPASDSSPSEEKKPQDLISVDGLFEVVSEKQSQEGQSLEDVLPQPQTIGVPAEPPSSSLTVKTLTPHQGPARAMKRCRKEYQNADLRYFSDTLFYTCTRKETESGFYYLTHVVIKDASQIKGDDSFGVFGGTRETPLDAAERTGAAILVNGSYFNYGTGYATGGELLIRDNQVVHGPYSDRYEICLRKDGTLFSPGYNTIESVLKEGVVFSWGTCEDLLIRDGKKMELTDYDWNGYSYPRTSIGMVRPLEYYIITAGGADYEGGITVYEEQEIFSDLHCAYARGLDGGGSSALVIDGEYVNENGDRLEDGTLQRRAVADFLLFTE